MTKHLTPQETQDIALDAIYEHATIIDQDGVRNAAIWAPVKDAAVRFHERPHAPETTINPVNDEGDRVAKAYRVADAYRVAVSAPLVALARDQYDPETIERAHGAVAQFAAAARQLAGALEDYQLALYEHMRAVNES